MSVFQTFKLSTELQLNTKIKSVQSDWGGEYRPFSALLVIYGISHRLICPHTHHQNGVVERKHRHIVDLGLTLLHHATLPLQFWDYVFVTVVYLINRFSYLDLFSSSSSSTQNITSYFSLNPDLSSPVSASTPSVSQIPSTNSLSAPSVPLGFSPTALNQTSSESTSPHPQSSNIVSSSESIPTAPFPLILNHQILWLIVNLCLHQL